LEGLTEFFWVNNKEKRRELGRKISFVAQYDQALSVEALKEDYKHFKLVV
jgi:hypothetical protein